MLHAPLNVKYANWLGIKLESLVQSKRGFERRVAHRVAWPPNLVVTTVITLMSLFVMEGHTRTNRKEARHLKTLNLISSYLLTNGFQMTVPCNTLWPVQQQDIYIASTCCCVTQAYQPYTIMICNTRTCSVLFRSKDSNYKTKWPKTQHQLSFLLFILHFLCVVYTSTHCGYDEFVRCNLEGFAIT